MKLQPPRELVIPKRVMKGITKIPFLYLLYSNITWREGCDKLSGRLCRSGEFDVRSFYKALVGPSDLLFPCRSIWKLKAPRRVALYIWTVAWGRILVIISLMLCMLCLATFELWCFVL